MKDSKPPTNPLADLDNVFSYHPPADQATVERYERIRNAGHHLAQVIQEETPAGADQSAAQRKVREAVMTANAAVALEPGR